MILYCVLGFIFISLVGSILHFVYDWLNHNKHISFFVAVNESTWEHIKLAIIPTFLWAIIGIILDYNNFAFSIFVILLIIVILIPTIFYTYTHFSKKPILAIDISSFFISVGLSIFVGYLIMSSNELSPVFNYIGIYGTILFCLATIIFTYCPPHIFLFKDPITKKYGIKGHYDDKKFDNNFKIK